ncbi:uncharacterized protein LOC113464648 [Ceratina calcarata]|uniref:Uncharacterized protein LOC113464648 n=1 Tax=Ceratina calcarata TaxID=156304 RepID=A0AAJ7WCH6_9HYME|nr:uncharacterized protein LOC113464648 [Ceratina calcarata]
MRCGIKENQILFNLEKKKVIVARDVTFKEQSSEESNDIIIPITTEAKAIQTDTASTHKENLIEMCKHDNVKGHDAENEDMESVQIDQNVIAVDPPTKKRANKRKLDETLTLGPRLRDRDKIKRPKRYECNSVDIYEPIDYQDARNSPEAKCWEQAIEEELENEALDCFKKYYNEVVVQQKKRIIILRSDNGLEFTNKLFKDFVNTLTSVSEWMAKGK